MFNQIKSKLMTKNDGLGVLDKLTLSLVDNAYLLAAAFAMVFAAVDYASKDEGEAFSYVGWLGLLTVPVISVLEVRGSNIAVKMEVPKQMGGYLDIVNDDIDVNNLRDLIATYQEKVKWADEIYNETFYLELLLSVFAMIFGVAGRFFFSAFGVSVSSKAELGLLCFFYIIEAAVYGYHHQVLEEYKEDSQREFSPKKIRDGFVQSSDEASSLNASFFATNNRDTNARRKSAINVVKDGSDYVVGAVKSRADNAVSAVKSRANSVHNFVFPKRVGRRNAITPENSPQDTLGNR